MPAWRFVLTLQPVNLVGETSGWAARILRGVLLFLKEKENGVGGGRGENKDNEFRDGHGGDAHP